MSYAFAWFVVILADSKSHGRGARQTGLHAATDAVKSRKGGGLCTRVSKLVELVLSPDSTPHRSQENRL